MMAAVDDLVVWLRAQLDEDYRLAQEWLDDTTSAWWWDNADPASAAERVIVRNSPRQLLAEVDAKRRILDFWEATNTALEVASGTLLAGACRVRLGAYDNAVKAIALPYSDRPGYREGWRPTQ